MFTRRPFAFSDNTSGASGLKLAPGLLITAAVVVVVDDVVVADGEAVVGAAGAEGLAITGSSRSARGGTVGDGADEATPCESAGLMATEEGAEAVPSTESNEDEDDGEEEEEGTPCFNARSMTEGAEAAPCRSAEEEACGSAEEEEAEEEPCRTESTERAVPCESAGSMAEEEAAKAVPSTACKEDEVDGEEEEEGTPCSNNADFRSSSIVETRLRNEIGSNPVFVTSSKLNIIASRNATARAQQLSVPATCFGMFSGVVSVKPSLLLVVIAFHCSSGKVPGPSLQK